MKLLINERRRCRTFDKGCADGKIILNIATAVVVIPMSIQLHQPAP
jgi:hypothetical protein